MISLKPGVSVRGIKPEAVLAVLVAWTVYFQQGLFMTITSCFDGRHRSGSLHYMGLAFDCRSKDLTAAHKAVVVDNLRRQLGLAYDVLLEDEGQANEHIHVEFDPDADPLPGSMPVDPS